MEIFWNKNPQLIAELSKVKTIMKNTIGHPDSFVRDPIFQMIEAGGKMLRPSLLILSSKFGNYDSKRVLPVAAAIELLHTATLIHDDIIDNSRIRRGIETIQSKIGKDAAVYSGDYIIARSFMLINEQYDENMIKNLSKKISQICVGELKQYRFRYNSDISIYDYIKIVSAKTAALFSLSMYIGAYLGGIEEKTTRLFGLTGLRAGIAYQIIDDCLDYCGTDATILKSSHNDLKQGFYTLPLICALRNDKKGTLKSLLDTSNFSGDAVYKIYNIVVEKNGIHDAKRIAEKYTEKAYDALRRLPECESRATLDHILNALLDRQY